MRLLPFCCIAALLGTVPRTASADVLWEHTVTLRMTKFKRPLLKVKLYSAWTPQRNRMLARYDLKGLSQVDAAETAAMLPIKRPPMPFATFGSAALVQRLDDDRLIGYLSQTKSYIDEPVKQLAQRLRFDPWKKLAPKLSQEAPPQLTLEQRKRLGAEIRAAVSPLEKRFYKLYFRPLNAKRTFNGVEAEGYRFTELVNAGGLDPQSAQWMRVNVELWLARDLPGDQAIIDFTKAAQDESRRAMWRSSSMWLNEFFPVMWQTLPPEFLKMIETLVPPANSPRAGFGGTPVRIYYTLIFPPLQRSSVGEVHEEVALTHRDTSPLNDAVFQSPHGYKQVKLDPFLKQYEDLMQGKIPGMMTFGDFNQSMGFSWQAWREYGKAVQRLMPLALR